MDFSNYYVLQELTIKANRDVRFLASNDNKKDWVDNIQAIINAADASGVRKEIIFLITDPTGNFVLNLVYSPDKKGFTYAVREHSLTWMHHHNLTDSDTNQGFYYDEESKIFVIQRHGLEEAVENDFDYNGLDMFLGDMFHINRLCKPRRGFAIVSVLYYLDKFTQSDVEKLKSNAMSPRWFISSLKSDEYRKEGGLFGFFKR